jgi:hypothetical protein
MASDAEVADLTSASFQNAGALVLPPKAKDELTPYEEAILFTGGILKNCGKLPAAYLHVVQASLLADSPVQRRIWLAREFKNDSFLKFSGAFEYQSVALDGRLRRSALLPINGDVVQEALFHIAMHANHSVLVLGAKIIEDESAMLACLAAVTVEPFLDDKKIVRPHWLALISLLESVRAVIVVGVGWPEDHCDFRFVAIGAKEVLKTVFEELQN